MAQLFRDKNGHTAPFFKEGTSQNVSVASTSATTTTAVGAATKLVRLSSTTHCYYRFGSAPTAVNTDPVLPAAVDRIIEVPAGGGKVAFLRVSADGTASVTELV